MTSSGKSGITRGSAARCAELIIHFIDDSISKESNMKRTMFSLLQPSMLLLIMVFWSSAPASWIDNPFTVTAVSITTLLIVQVLELFIERHASWRMYRLQFLTGLFFSVLHFSVVSGVWGRAAQGAL